MLWEHGTQSQLRLLNDLKKKCETGSFNLLISVSVSLPALPALLYLCLWLSPPVPLFFPSFLLPFPSLSLSFISHFPCAVFVFPCSWLSASSVLQTALVHLRSAQMTGEFPKPLRFQIHTNRVWLVQLSTNHGQPNVSSPTVTWHKCTWGVELV